MSNYASWGPTSQHQQRLPPTPPDYQGDYNMADATYYPAAGFHSRHNSTRERSDRYHQASSYSTQPTIHGHPRAHHMSYDSYTHGHHAYQYAAAPAPTVLPPIRNPMAIDPYMYGHHEKKEDKPTGGVAQHLDYEMDVMASFVSEMAQKLIIPGSEPPREFRKYVSQILSSTRLPSSTIMLGLFYLATRMKIVKELGHDVSGSGIVYRMLTTCLLLGSKFLDDNTFQNKSWAEVSSIPVVDLNLMELDWLQGFNWEIHSLMYNEQENFFDWIHHWKDYEKRAKNIKVKEMHKLAPIETKFAPRYSRQHPIMMSPEGPIPTQYQQSPQYDTQWARHYMQEYSPPSAPHSGPATPEYYPHSQQWSYPSANNLRFTPYGNTYPGYGHQQNQWAHAINCGCGTCAKGSDFYFHGSYPVQTVVG